MTAAGESAAKAALRGTAKARRAGLSEADGATAPMDVLAGFLAAPELVLQLVAGRVCAGYAPIASELDPGPLLRHLAACGLGLALPVTCGRDAPLVFRGWSWGGPLEPGPFGVPVPPANAPTVEPDLLVVPLLAYDGRGHRLGYGAGYYDRTLAACRQARNVTAVGLAFAGQRIDAVPTTPRDQALDWVVTEAGAEKFV